MVEIRNQVSDPYPGLQTEFMVKIRNQVSDPYPGLQTEFMVAVTQSSWSQ
jgi:hypothetical protein